MQDKEPLQLLLIFQTVIIFKVLTDNWMHFFFLMPSLFFLGIPAPILFLHIVDVWDIFVLLFSFREG